jgi:hypothetical protein
LTNLVGDLIELSLVGSGEEIVVKRFQKTDDYQTGQHLMQAEWMADDLH